MLIKSSSLPDGFKQTLKSKAREPNKRSSSLNCVWYSLC